MPAVQLLICSVLAAVLSPVSSQLIAGGISNTTLPKDDESVLFAVNAINQKNANLSAAANSSYIPLELESILSVQQQVVAGMKYYLTLLMKEPSHAYVCSVTVWFRPWLTGDDRLQVNDLTCVPFNGSSTNPQSIDTTTTTPANSSGLSTPQPTHMSQSATQALLYAIRRLNQLPRIHGAYTLELGDTSNMTVIQKDGPKTSTYLFKNVKLVKTTCQFLDRFLAIMLGSYACSPVGTPMVVTCTFWVTRRFAWLYPVYNLMESSC